MYPNQMHLDCSSHLRVPILRDEPSRSRNKEHSLPGDIRIFALAWISYVNARDREHLAAKGYGARTVDAVYSNERQEKAIEISRVEWLRRTGGRVMALDLALLLFLPFFLPVHWSSSWFNLAFRFRNGKGKRLGRGSSMRNVAPSFFAFHPILFRLPLHRFLPPRISSTPSGINSKYGQTCTRRRLIHRWIRARLGLIWEINTLMNAVTRN